MPVEECYTVWYGVVTLINTNTASMVQGRYPTNQQWTDIMNTILNGTESTHK